jgi:hypothetical protein
MGWKKPGQGGLGGFELCNDVMEEEDVGYLSHRRGIFEITLAVDYWYC